jgi:hypothetical protein
MVAVGFSATSVANNPDIQNHKPEDLSICARDAQICFKKMQEPCQNFWAPEGDTKQDLY